MRFRGCKEDKCEEGAEPSIEDGGTDLCERILHSFLLGPRVHHERVRNVGGVINT